MFFTKLLVHNLSHSTTTNDSVALDTMGSNNHRRVRSNNNTVNGVASLHPDEPTRRSRPLQGGVLPTPPTAAGDHQQAAVVDKDNTNMMWTHNTPPGRSTTLHIIGPAVSHDNYDGYPNSSSSRIGVPGSTANNTSLTSQREISNRNNNNMNVKRRRNLHQPCVKNQIAQQIIRGTMILTTLVSMIFAYVSASGCEFLLVGAKNENDNNTKSNYLGYGMFNEAFYDEANTRRGCLPYLTTFREQYVTDPAFGAGRAFSIMTILLETVAMFLLILTTCFLRRGRDIIWKIIRFVLAVSILTQLLTFSVFASDFCKQYDDLETDCQAGLAATLASVNVFLLIILILLSCSVPPPPHPVFMLWDPSRITTRFDTTDDDYEGKTEYHRRRRLGGVEERGEDRIMSSSSWGRRNNYPPPNTVEDGGRIIEVEAGGTFDMLQEPSTQDEDEVINEEVPSDEDDVNEEEVAWGPDSSPLRSSYDASSRVVQDIYDGIEAEEVAAAAAAASYGAAASTERSRSTAAGTSSIQSDFGNNTHSNIIFMDDTSSSFDESGSDSVIYETVVVPQGIKKIQTVTHTDGTQTVTQTVTHTDGSQTVTTTLKPLNHTMDSGSSHVVAERRNKTL